MPGMLVLILTAALFLAAGAAAGFWFGQQRGRADAARSNELEKEFDAYRQRVTDHFGKTADHFQALGVQVRELYDHMAAGADALCDRETAERAIEFSAARALQEGGGSEAEETRGADAAAPDSGDEAADEKAAGSGAPPGDYAAPAPEAEAKPASESITIAAGEEEADPDKRSYH